MALCAPSYRGSLVKLAQFGCKLASDLVVISVATMFNGTCAPSYRGSLAKLAQFGCKLASDLVVISVA